MKKMLLIGGIISTVLPAMATDLDLSGYNLITGNTTCTGSDFADGSVDMTPLYIRECAAGSYINVTNETSVQEHETNNELDYYYVDACSTCPDGSYCLGVTDPALVNGALSTTGASQCPTGYDHSDGTRASDANCYKTCSNSNIDGTLLGTLHASGAYYSSNGSSNDEKAYYGTDCTIHISGCVPGYDSLDLTDGSTLAKCALNEVSCSGDLTAGDVSLSNGRRSYQGTFSCSNAGVCSATINKFAVKKSDNSGWFDAVDLTNSISVTGTDYGTEVACQAACGSETGWDALIAAEIADTANGGILTDGTSFCAAKIVDVDWVGKPAGTCTYDGALTAPEAPVVNGYEFVGWTLGLQD